MSQDKNKQSGKKKDSESGEDRLSHWQELVAADEAAYQSEIGEMTTRENIYRGRKEIDEILEGDLIKTAPHVRNIVHELIESQINSSIPQPKVTPLRREDEKLATLIEDMIRNRLNKLPMETINDLMERTVPVQGGSFLHYEWDNNRHTHTTVGEGVCSFRHPKQVIPQAGITADIEIMDRVTIKVPQTADSIQRLYGVDVSEEGEADPSIRSGEGQAAEAEGMVTQYLVYYRNERGGIGLYSWVGEQELIDLEDYQARRNRVCGKCGQPEPFYEVDELPPTLDGNKPNESQAVRRTPGDGGNCPNCGGGFVEGEEELMQTPVAIELPNGETLPAGVQVPYYKPDIYPTFLQRNVSSFGKFLGESDVDKIRDQQNTMNRLYAKVLAQLLNAGSYVTLPQEVNIKKDSEEGKVLRLRSAADKSMIDVIDLTPNITPALTMIDRIYLEAQRLLGISDSFIGQKDSTATSGKAKEFSAAQAAGRLESKRVMKNEMYARFFEGIFKFELAYADEARPVVGTDNKGNHTDEEWSKWLFLKQDEAGTYYWNTDFLFETDSTAPLANNREALWQETRSHFAQGAYGDPADVETQIMYWEQMAALHYPNASRIRDRLIEKREAAAQLQLQQAMAEKEALQQAQMEAGALAGTETALPGGIEPELLPQLPAPEGLLGGELL